MLSLVKLFAGLFKAFPKLADLFEDAVYHFRNASAEVHRTEKDNAVDAFIDSSNSGVSCDSVQWSGEVDETPGGEGGGESSTTVHSGSFEGDKPA